MKKKKGLSLVIKLILLAVLPVLLTGGIVTVVGITSMEDGMGTTKLDDLAYIARSISAAYEALDAGEYYMDGDNLMKGELNITAQEALLDSYTAGTENEITFFYGDTRRATTILDGSGNRIVGTPCTDAVYQAVIVGGEVYEASSVPINGENYFAAYLPMKNGNEVVGMIFCGAPQADVTAFITGKAAAMMSAFVIMTIISVVIVGISVFSTLAYRCKGINLFLKPI